MTLPIFWIKPSHRSWAEQVVGAAIFLVLSFAAHLFVQLSFEANDFSIPWIVYHVCLGCAIWTLWRRHSLKGLTLELAGFLCALILEIASFYFSEQLFALATLIFLWSSLALTMLLYWKKERMAGQMLFPGFLWIFYIMGTNMAICLS